MRPEPFNGRIAINPRKRFGRPCDKGARIAVDDVLSWLTSGMSQPAILFYQNISFRIFRLLKDVYPGCLHLSRCGLTVAEDPDIWMFARKNGLAIVTIDQDN